jgi:hypothetical protein
MSILIVSIEVRFPNFRIKDYFVLTRVPPNSSCFLRLQIDTYLRGSSTIKRNLKKKLLICGNCWAGMAKADATFITSTTDFHVKICSKPGVLLRPE